MPFTIQESGEMYLESILVLSQKLNTVRSIDVAEEMGVSKPAVSRAVGKLKDEAFIDVDEAGAITLTEKGYGVAAKIYERHTLLTQFLVRLGVDEETAAQDACKIEHDISDATFEALKNHALRHSG